MAGLIDSLFEELMSYFEPVIEAVRDRDAFEDLLFRNGYHIALAGEVHAALSGEGALLAAVDSVETTYREVRAANDNGGATDAQYLAFATATGDLVLLLEALALPGVPDLPPELASAQTVADIGRAIAGFLTADYLRRRRPGLHALLFALGVVQRETVPAAPPFRQAHERETIDWSAISDVLSGPEAHLAELYGWDQPAADFNIDRTVTALSLLATAFGIPNDPDLNLPQVHNSRFADSARPVPETASIRLLFLDLQNVLDGAIFKIGADVLALSDTSDLRPRGLALVPILTGEIARDFSVAPRITLEVETGAAPLAGRPMNVLPGSPGWEPGPGDARLAARLRYGPEGPDRFLLGNDTTANITLSAAALEAALSVEGTDPLAEVRLVLGNDQGGGLGISLPASDSDTFLRRILGEGDLTLETRLDLRWSSATGFQFAAEGAITVSLAPSIDLGPIDLLGPRLELRARAGDQTSAVETAFATDLRAAIGPVSATMIGLGFGATAGPVDPADPPDVRLGDVGLNLALRPPEGAAIRIRSAGVTGGGFLLRDAPRAAYAGQIVLDLGGLALSAFGDIATRDAQGRDLPSPGFSMVLLLGLRFPAIQIGLGFNLRGVGGLIGLHRRTDVDLLKAGLTNGALDAVMFPDNPSDDPSRAVAGLAQLFPIAPERHLIGPLLLLGWGTPNLVDIELGVIFEIGGASRILLLGRLRSSIPRESDDGPAVLRINLGLSGALDPGNGRLELDGTLRNSTIAGADLTGDMAARLGWEGNPDFIFSFGGFHPDYRPELAVPKLAPLAVNISRGTSLRLSVEAYLALTSNTLQFGGHAELVVRKSSFSLEGDLDFHAIFEFSPFAFIVSLDFDVSLRFKGRTFASVGLEFELSGPHPWRAKGRVKIKIVLVTFKLPFNISWGTERPLLEPPREIWPALEAALGRDDAWAAIAPGARRRDVTLMTRTEDNGPVVHPHGTLEIRQRLLPLDLELDRIGAAPVDGDRRFSITALSVAGANQPVRRLDGSFAAAQFFDLDRDERLARPSFEAMNAGAGVGSDLLADAGGRRSVTIGHDTELVQPRTVRRPPLDFGHIHQPPLTGRLQKMSLAGRARSTTDAGGPFRNESRASAVQVRSEDYAIVDQATGAAGPARAGSRAEAEQILRRVARAGTAAARLSVVAGSAMP